MLMYSLDLILKKSSLDVPKSLDLVFAMMSTDGRSCPRWW